jgi:hypothetical protein
MQRISICVFLNQTYNDKETMMRAKILVILLSFVLPALGLALFLPPSIGLGQEAVDIPANPDLRFQLEREGDGYVRLDKKTGETSYCRRVNDKLVCTLAIEERDTLHQEIADLQNQVAALREELKALPNAEPRPKEDVPDTSLKDNSGSERDKIEQEMDRAIDLTKQALRKLYTAMKELRKEFEDDPAD